MKDKASENVENKSSTNREHKPDTLEELKAKKKLKYNGMEVNYHASGDAWLLIPSV